MKSLRGKQWVLFAFLFSILGQATAQDMAPVITNDLADQIGGEGILLRQTLNATASTTLTNAYFWYHNGELIETPAANIRTISSASLADAGNYYVVVSNAIGRAISRTNTVSIVPRSGPGMVMEEDTTWQLFTNKHMHAFAEDAAGNILVGGAAIIRLRNDLTLDQSFPAINAGAGKYVYKMIPTSDGGFFACGDFTLGKVSGVAKFRSNGVIDTNFNAGFSTLSPPALKTMMPVEGDRLMVGGTFQIRTASRTNTGIALLLSDGKVDSSFHPPTPNGVVYDLARATNGDYFVAGAFSRVGTNIARGLVRLRSDGSIAMMFPILLGYVRQILSEADDALIAVGEFRLEGQTRTIGLARFGADGSYDARLPEEVVISPETEDQMRPLLRTFDGRIVTTGPTRRSPWGPTVASFFTNGAADTNFFCGLDALETIHQLRDGSFLGAGFLEISAGAAPGISHSASVVRLYGDPDRKVDTSGAANGALAVKTVATHHYAVEKAGDLAGEWKVEEEFDGDGAVHQFLNAGAGGTNCFYRVKISFGTK